VISERTEGFTNPSGENSKKISKILGPEMNRKASTKLKTIGKVIAFRRKEKISENSRL